MLWQLKTKIIFKFKHRNAPTTCRAASSRAHSSEEALLRGVAALIRVVAAVPAAGIVLHSHSVKAPAVVAPALQPSLAVAVKVTVTIALGTPASAGAARLRSGGGDE